MTSTGKVRIYELSRDLGLENKDVLDAAEKLSIPAKSHSSSISEVEAAKIRDLVRNDQTNLSLERPATDSFNLTLPKHILATPIKPIVSTLGKVNTSLPITNKFLSKSASSAVRPMSIPLKPLTNKPNASVQQPSEPQIIKDNSVKTIKATAPVARPTLIPLKPLTNKPNLPVQQPNGPQINQDDSIKAVSSPLKPTAPVTRPTPIKPLTNKPNPPIQQLNGPQITQDDSIKAANSKSTAPVIRATPTTVKPILEKNTVSPRPGIFSKVEVIQKNPKKTISSPSKPTAPVLRPSSIKVLIDKPDLPDDVIDKQDVTQESQIKSSVVKLTPPAFRPNTPNKPEIVQKAPVKLAAPVPRPVNTPIISNDQRSVQVCDDSLKSTGVTPSRRPVIPPPQRINPIGSKLNLTEGTKQQLVNRPQSHKSGAPNSKAGNNSPPISRPSLNIQQKSTLKHPDTANAVNANNRPTVNTLELVGKPIRRDSTSKRPPVEAPKRQSNAGQGMRKPMAPGELMQLQKPGSRSTAPPPRRADGSIAGVNSNSEIKAIPPGPRPTAMPPSAPRRPGFRNPAPGGGTRRPSRPDWDDSAKLEALRSKTPQKQRKKVHIIGDNDDPLTTQTGGYAGEQDAVVLQASLARPSKPKIQKQGGTAKPIVAMRKRKKETTRQRQRRRAMELRASREAKQARPDMLIVPEGNLTVQELADKLGTESSEIIKSLFFKGIIATVTQTLDLSTIETVSEEFGVPVLEDDVEEAAKKTVEMIEESDFKHLIRRPPVVTVMGHVDHGKTSLLDAIRKTRVAAGEAGGITQHIGAYQIEVTHSDQQRKITFLDTPGHEAFTAMRARGAKVTDVAVLVVAADDGVRPQTLEAISHARAAEVPIIVAINKIDKEGAQIDRVKQELSDQNLLAEEWGGNTVMVPVSAIRGENIDKLLEMILLVTEVEDLQANPDRMAKGTVIEAHLDKAKGPVATLLIQNGTLRAGDVVAAGPILGKVRAMMDHAGKRVKEAGPSCAVEALGFSEVPTAGDEFEVYLDEKAARAVVGERANEARATRLAQQMASRRVSLATMSGQASEGELKELNLILKADVQGSVEAILGALEQLPKDEVQVRVLLSAPGEITETDVDLAAASGAVIIGFNTSMASGAKRAADTNGVDVREYDVIYKLLEDIQMAMEGLLEPESVEETLGEAEVRAVFSIGKSAVAGCYVLSGKIQRNTKIRVRRGKQLIFEGDLNSLRRNKDDIKEVATGFECGIGCDRFANWEDGDRIEVYKMVTQRRTLNI